jgi:glycosyltransferase involved in cell wall biosynthesis
MKKPRIVIAGCARDCGLHLNAIFQNIGRLSAYYADLALVVVENDSSDDTAIILKRNLIHFVRHSIVQIPELAEHIPIRTKRLAFLRNLVLDILKEDRFNDSDYVLMIDFDEVCTDPWNIDEIESAIKYLESVSDLAACFSNCSGHYYDLWALRHPNVCPSDIWLDSFALRLATRCTVDEAFTQVVSPKIFQIPPSLSPFQVDSAFGGMGIYKLKALRESKGLYVGEQHLFVSSHDKSTIIRYQWCEHVPFHTSLTKQLGAKLAIFPSLITQNTHRRRFIPSAMDALVIETLKVQQA